jgi:hypothetical protein
MALFMATRLDYSHGQDNNRKNLGLLDRATVHPGEPLIPDETVFGVLSRRHLLTGRVWSAETLIETMNKRTFSPGTAFPSSLNSIAECLGIPDHDVEALIRKHTILPYFRPFSSGTKYKEVFESIRSGSAAATKISLGVIASRIGAEDWLRFCPLCVAEDLETMGVATWYRVQQLPGVLVCPYHAIPLMESKCLAHRVGWQQLFLPRLDDPSFHVCDGAKNLRASDRLLHIAKLSAQALTLSAHQCAKRPLRSLYMTYLLNHGLAASPNRVRQRELCDQFRNYWQPLTEISPFDRLLHSLDANTGWLATLCRKARCNHHPLKHLLLIGLFHDDLFSLFDVDSDGGGIVPVSRQRDASPSKTVASQLEDLVVRHGMSIRKASEQIGITTNTAIQHADKAGIPVNRRPKRMNANLNAVIRKALADGKDVQIIANNLGLSTATINRALGKDLNLQYQRAERKHLDRLNQARAIFIKIQQRFPQAGVKLLRTAIPADFMWLYRHDNAWLRRHTHRTQQRPCGKTTVDWTVRDVEMAVLVSRVGMEIINFPGKPVRVTLNEVGRRTGHTSWLQKQLVKLPRTRALLPKVLEPLEAFQARRLEYWEKQLSPSGLFCGSRDWRVFRAAGIHASSA